LSLLGAPTCASLPLQQFAGGPASVDDRLSTILKPADHHRPAARRRPERAGDRCRARPASRPVWGKRPPHDIDAGRGVHACLAHEASAARRWRSERRPAASRISVYLYRSGRRQAARKQREKKRKAAAASADEGRARQHQLLAVRSSPQRAQLDRPVADVEHHPPPPRTALLHPRGGAGDLRALSSGRGGPPRGRHVRSLPEGAPIPPLSPLGRRSPPVRRPVTRIGRRRRRAARRR